jgi:predicted nuclease of predicted toxin-antitoxin system
VPPPRTRVAASLRGAGYEASHVVDHGLLRATDEVILAYATRNDQVIVSAAYIADRATLFRGLLTTGYASGPVSPAVGP